MKSPIRKRLPLMVIAHSEKSGMPPNIPISGVMMSFTSAWTTPVNAAPITMPTARSTTLPRRMNFLNPPSWPPTPDTSLPEPDRAAFIAIAHLPSAAPDSGVSHHSAHLPPMLAPTHGHPACHRPGRPRRVAPAVADSLASPAGRGIVSPDTRSPGDDMDLRALQRPLKEQYRAD